MLGVETIEFWAREKKYKLFYGGKVNTTGYNIEIWNILYSPPPKIGPWVLETLRSKTSNEPLTEITILEVIIDYVPI